MFRQRLRLLLFFYFAGLSLVALRLFHVQVIGKETYSRRSVISTIRQSSISLLRGAIKDRNGKIMARSTASYDIEVRPGEFDQFTYFADLFKISPQELASKLDDIRLEVFQDQSDILDRKIAGKLGPALLKEHKVPNRKALIKKIGKIQWDHLIEFWQKENPKTTAGMKKWSILEAERKYYTLFSNIPYTVACRLSVKNIPGVKIRAHSKRVYQDPLVAPHLLGQLGNLHKEEFEEKRYQGYLPIDYIGRTGIERFYEDKLKGPRGLRLTEFDKEKLQRKVIFEDVLTPNQDVYLTLDFDLQAWTEEVLDTYSGEGPGLLACVVMRVEDGQILAMATTPRFALDTFSKRYTELKDNSRYPLLNRCVQNYINPNPGSVFKLLTSIALIEDNIIDRSTTANCRGYLHNPRSFRCHVWDSRRGGHGTVNLEQSIERSCNIFFYKYGEELGIERLAYWADRFGFGLKTKIEVDRESPGLIPTPAWKKKAYKGASKGEQSWNVGETRLCAIGQKVEVTPLQVTRFVAAIANGGYLVQPHLVHNPNKNYKNPEQLCHPATLARVIKGMELVVHGSHGTAQRYGLDKFQFVGKTGTADTKKGKEPHAWISGFAPQKNPEIAISIIAEYAGHGGDVCGPLAQKILAKYFDN